MIRRILEIYLKPYGIRHAIYIHCIKQEKQVPNFYWVFSFFVLMLFSKAMRWTFYTFEFYMMETKSKVMHILRRCQSVASKKFNINKKGNSQRDWTNAAPLFLFITITWSYIKVPEKTRTVSRNPYFINSMISKSGIQ